MLPGCRREELSTHQVVMVVLPTEARVVLRIRNGSTPEKVHRQIHQTLQILEEVMKPVKSWAFLLWDLRFVEAGKYYLRTDLSGLARPC